MDAEPVGQHGKEVARRTIILAVLSFFVRCSPVAGGFLVTNLVQLQTPQKNRCVACNPAPFNAYINKEKRERHSLCAKYDAEKKNVSLHRQAKISPMLRSYEWFIFLFYFGVGASSSLFALSRALIHQQRVETTLALIWSGMVLAISFLEAWVKFRAPFLRKHVAVDVGRHVFAALNAAELGLTGAFWISRLLFIRGVRMASIPWRKLSSLEFIFPTLATAALFMEVVYIAPRLFHRAKYQISKALETSASGELSSAEQSSLRQISDEIRGKLLPSAKWHVVYVGLELIKVSCLMMFVISSWMKTCV